MLRRTNISPRTLETLVVIVAIVALMIPTCAMVGCTMTGQSMFMPFGNALSMHSLCGGTYVVSKSPLSTGPVNTNASLWLVTVAALVMAFSLVAPRAEADPIRSARDGPPSSSDLSDDVPLRI
jgi:hypothetical protein